MREVVQHPSNVLCTGKGDGTQIVDVQKEGVRKSSKTSYAHDPDLLVRGRRKRQATSPKATFAQFVTAPPTTATTKSVMALKDLA